MVDKYRNGETVAILAVRLSSLLRPSEAPAQQLYRPDYPFHR